MARELNAGMPSDLDVGPTYSLRVTAIDATSGALVSGVTIGAVTFTATLVEGDTSGGQIYGDWFLVPGPGA